MAFSAAVKASAHLGPGLKMTVGTWSGIAGDAAGTITVSGAHVWGALFFKMDNDNTSQVFPKFSVATSGSTTTITVQNQDNVTTGRFVIYHQS